MLALIWSWGLPSDVQFRWLHISIVPTKNLIKEKMSQNNDRCSTNPAWTATPAAYMAADTDNQLGRWWASQLAGDVSFSRALGQSFWVSEDVFRVQDQQGAFVHYLGV